MALAIAATQTAPDVWRFDVTGVDIAAAPTFVINFGDASAPLTVTTDPDGTTTVTHTYTDPGHHSYTVTVTAAATPYAATLAALDAKHVGPNIITNGTFDTDPNLNWYSVGATQSLQSGAMRVDIPGPDATPTMDDSFTATTITTVAGTYDVRFRAWASEPAAVTQIVASDFTVALSTTPQWFTGKQTVPAGVRSFYFLFGGVLPRPWTAYIDDVSMTLPGTLAALAAAPELSTLADIPRNQVTATATVTVDVGPATIWATVIPGDPVPVVQVDVWIGDPETVIGWQVDRIAGGQTATIWVGDESSGAMSLVDHTAPVGVPVTYRLTVTYTDYSATIITSAPVTIYGTAGCYLTDPATGVTLRVELATWPIRRFNERRAVLTVLGRRDPVVLADVHSTAEGVWTFITRTDEATAALVAMLANLMGVVVYRAQPGTSIVSCTAAVGVIEERRYSGSAGDQRRLVAAEIQEIAPLPATALPLNATLGGLATFDGDTLAELHQLRPTLLQLSMIVTG